MCVGELCCGCLAVHAEERGRRVLARFYIGRYIVLAVALLYIVWLCGQRERIRGGGDVGVCVR